MGFVIWYQVVFPHGGPGGLLPLRVSNDVFGGEFIADADIVLDMSAGVTAGWFELRLLDLPAAMADTLIAQQQQHGPLDVAIGLGYFDDPATQRSPAMSGTVHTITTSVDTQGRLVTEVQGLETAGYLLSTTAFAHDAAGAVTVAALAKEIADAAGIQAFSGSDLASATDVTIRARSCMEALRQLTAPPGDGGAQAEQVPVVIADGAVRLGNAVGAQPGAVFADRDNVVSIERQQRQVEQPGTFPDAAPATGVTSLLDAKPAPNLQNQHKLTVLGDPTLRPGQNVTYRPADSGNAIPGSLRVDHVRHQFGSGTGYICAVTVLAADPGKPGGRPDGARGLAQRLTELAANAVTERPAVDIGEIESYKAENHIATVHYGQPSTDPLTSASVQAEVARTPLLHDKPMLSPFAWHNVGLMVPVYPGMRAVLAHNRSQVNDALIAGYVWAQQTRQAPPRNQPGDWWLCLPTELGVADGLPTGTGVNDLTDASGHRVLQAKGLRITVGDGTLPQVGERPTPPGDGLLSIEHESGTTISISTSGAISIISKTGDITLSTQAASITMSAAGTIELAGTAITMKQGGAQ